MRNVIGSCIPDAQQCFPPVSDTERQNWISWQNTQALIRWNLYGQKKWWKAKERVTRRAA